MPGIDNAYDKVTRVYTAISFSLCYLAKNIYLTQIIQSIQNRIYTIRGLRVMIDRDLAELYATEIRSLNQAVKRNIARLPEDFMFPLTTNEWEQLQPDLLMREKSDPLRLQIVTLKPSTGQHRKFLPYVFTEQGVAMLSSVLHSSRIVQMNVAIMRAFVKTRRLAMENNNLKCISSGSAKDWVNTIRS